MIKCIFDSYFLLPAITLLSSLGNTALCPAAHHYTLITFSLNFPSSCISQGGGRVCTRALDPEREAAIAQCWGEEGSVQWFHLQPLDQASQPRWLVTRMWTVLGPDRLSPTVFLEIQWLS